VIPLEMEDVRKRFGDVVALDGASVTVRAGEIVGLLGPNGSGKTTLTSIAAGLLRPDGGRVRVGGIDPAAHPSRARRHLGIAPQTLGVYPVVSVRDNLRLFGRLAGLSRAQARERAFDLAIALDLGPVLDDPVQRLSGGQRRRVHTAMALMAFAPLVMLDEPTVGMDVAAREDLLELVRDVAREGSGVCYSTHYMGEIESLGASVAILDRGRIIAEGTVDELVRAHGRPMVELGFHGPAPVLATGSPTEVDGCVARLVGDSPSQLAASAMAALGPHAERLRSVEIIRPSLETVYLTLTGQRWAIEGGADHAVAA